MLGQTVKLNGTIKISGSISYVPQQPWIQNATIKENILFKKPYNEEFYSHVVSSCALLRDFDILPYGDETDIGEKVSNICELLD
jgi:ABC-type transport system involved in cytochrome bd biosynthesis fused ATPase/permease subunit